MLYRNIMKPLLFKLDPETAHHATIGGLSAAGGIPGAQALLGAMYGVDGRRELTTDIWGLRFPNPVGLAAGLDKNGRAVKAFSRVGFGFMEVGTVTPRPQPGNPQPRLFRLPEDEALINRMGFNNEGADKLARRLAAARPYGIPLAVNIGKNKDTPNEEAVGDYIACVRELYEYADLFVVNISSPNTPDLRKLQHGSELRELLRAVMDEIGEQRAARHGKTVPVLVKIAPDLAGDELEQVVQTVADSGASGMIAANTTLDRSGLTHAHRDEAGGLSGKPLRDRSTAMIRRIYKLTGGALPIIGSGGIFSAEDAYEKIRAGASLVEIYTALIYIGPGVNRQINEGLSRLLQRDGFAHISQAVGVDATSS